MVCDPRIERHTESLKALVEYLREINAKPESFLLDDNLQQALQSQGALAKLSIPERGISGSSLNTVKRIASRVVKGGFSTVDVLRKGALQAIKTERAKGERSNKTTKIGLLERVKELEGENQLLREDLLLVTYALEKSLTQSLTYSSMGKRPVIMALCQREQRELMDMITSKQRISRT